MKKNFEEAMLDHEGKPYTDGLTLKTVALTALTMEAIGDERMTASDKVKIFLLATKLAPGGTIDLSVEELTLLRERIGKTIRPIACGYAFKLLDADPSTTTEKVTPA